MNKYELYENRAEATFALIEAKNAKHPGLLETGDKLIKEFKARNWEKAKQIKNEYLKSRGLL